MSDVQQVWPRYAESMMTTFGPPKVVLPGVDTKLRKAYASGERKGASA